MKQWALRLVKDLTETFIRTIVIKLAGLTVIIAVSLVTLLLVFVLLVWGFFYIEKKIPANVKTFAASLLQTPAKVETNPSKNETITSPFSRILRSGHQETGKSPAATDQLHNIYKDFSHLKAFLRTSNVVSEEKPVAKSRAETNRSEDHIVLKKDDPEGDVRNQNSDLDHQPSESRSEVNLETTPE
jgi:chorismate-pyruvate lyase